jgi:hypothetical protein
MTYTIEELERMKRNLGLDKVVKKKRRKKVKDRGNLEYLVTFSSNVNHNGESGYTRRLGRRKSIGENTFEELYDIMLDKALTANEKKIVGSFRTFHKLPYRREFYAYKGDALELINHTDKVKSHLEICSDEELIRDYVLTDPYYNIKFKVRYIRL